MFCLLTRHDFTPTQTKLNHELRTEKAILLKILPCRKASVFVLQGYSIFSSTPSPALLAGTLPKPSIISLAMMLKPSSSRAPRVPGGDPPGERRSALPPCPEDPQAGCSPVELGAGVPRGSAGRGSPERGPLPSRPRAGRAPAAPSRALPAEGARRPPTPRGRAHARPPQPRARPRPGGSQLGGRRRPEPGSCRRARGAARSLCPPRLPRDGARPPRSPGPAAGDAEPPCAPGPPAAAAPAPGSLLGVPGPACGSGGTSAPLPPALAAARCCPGATVPGSGRGSAGRGDSWGIQGLYEKQRKSTSSAPELSPENERFCSAV